MSTTSTIAAPRATAATPQPAGHVSVPDAPPEARGLARDEVRLLVTTSEGDRLTDFASGFAAALRPGDLVVVNDSATVPASLPIGDDDTAPERLHLSTPAPGTPVDVRDGHHWIVEVRHATRLGSAPSIADHDGRVLRLPAGGSARLLAPHPRGTGPSRLWTAVLTVPEPLPDYLDRHGRPIRYGDPATPTPLAAYQTLFARRPGSSEMPSAARPFTRRVLTQLWRRRIRVAAITLHTGVSSQDAGEAPYAEPYVVAPATALRIATTRRRGGRVIAVGTTVARALETVAHDDGTVRPGSGWTSHVISPASPVRVIDGIVTGWHEDGESHRELLTAVAGGAVLARAYQVATAADLAYHEFGDSHLILR